MINLNKIKILFLIIILLTNIFASGKTIIIPIDHQKIQSGINVSTNGDTILVMPGKYLENINFNGKKIVLGSNFILTNNKNDIEQTIIDGNKKGTVVSFFNGEDTSSILNGFTIQNGSSAAGGGINCYNSSPVLKNLVVKDNNATTDAGGGGVYCNYNANPIIDQVAVSNNTAIDHAGGIGIYYSKPKIIHSVIINNCAKHSGGIHLNNSNPEIYNTIIANNIAEWDAGICCWDRSKPDIVNCTIVNNYAHGFSGGVSCGLNSNPTFRNCILWNNPPAEIGLNSSMITISYSDVKGNVNGIGNLNSDPLFFDDQNGDFRLQKGSPCINAGDVNNAFMDKDNTRSDIGIFGGPFGESYVYPEKPLQIDPNTTFTKTSNILIVCDDKSNNSSRFLPFYIDALDKNNFKYDVWDCSMVGKPNSNTLNEFLNGVVIWFSPLRAGYICDIDAQQSIQNFLENGGKLFISGPYIGNYLKTTNFFKEYLHTKYKSDNIESFILDGIATDPITDGLTLLIEGDGAINNWQLNEIDAIPPAVSILKIKDNNNTAAIRVDTGKYKVVYFAFGFETINHEENRSFVINSILKWLEPSIQKDGISYISPTYGNNRSTIEVTVHGYGFKNPAYIKLIKSGYTDIVGFNTVYYDSTKIKTYFNLSDKPTGIWDIKISYPGFNELILNNAFNIENTHIDFKIEIIGRDQIRLGRKSQAIINIINTGNITSCYAVQITAPDETNQGNFNKRNNSNLTSTNYLITKPIYPGDVLPIQTQIISNQLGQINVIGSGMSLPSQSHELPESGVINWVVPIISHVFTENGYDIETSILNEMTQAFVLNMFRQPNFTYVYYDGFVKNGVNHIVQNSTSYNLNLPISIIPIKTEEVTSEIKTETKIEKQIIKKQNVVTSIDPNEKVNSKGFGKYNSLSKNDTLHYNIYFENLISATAPAQEIMIIDTLSENLDWNTFYFDDILIGSVFVETPNSAQVFSERLKLNDSTDIKIDAEFYPLYGILKWHFQGIDQTTGDWGDILPPNINAPEGEGWVGFSIKLKSDIRTGSRIINRAGIIFDVNPIIITNGVFNIIDINPPQSNIKSYKQIEDSLQYQIIWNGNDESDGSGLKSYDLYFSDNGNPYVQWLKDSNDTIAVFSCLSDHLYRFYSIAKDSVGNIESKPDSFDVMFIAQYHKASEIPKRYYLFQNFPNPFNDKTTIRYDLPVDSKVSMELFNIFGQKVRKLIDENEKAGHHTIQWNGNSDSESMISSGIYFIKFKAGNFSKIIKCIFLK